MFTSQFEKGKREVEEEEEEEKQKTDMQRRIPVPLVSMQEMSSCTFATKAERIRNVQAIGFGVGI
jgi:hypothetical protein